MRILFAALALGSFGCARAVPLPPSLPPTTVIVHAAPPPSSPRTCRYGERAACASACEAGDAPSCNNLGAMIESGAAPGEIAEAAELYARACRDGASAGCSNARRLDVRPAASARPEPPLAPPPAREEPPAPPPPSLAELRARCAKGDADACDALPGIHISGNVHIHGNVTMTGDVYLHGRR